MNYGTAALEAHKRLGEILPRTVHCYREASERSGRRPSATHKPDSTIARIIAVLADGPLSLAEIVARVDAPAERTKRCVRWLTSTRELKNIAPKAGGRSAGIYEIKRAPADEDEPC